MNIFVVDRSPIKAAVDLPDKLVVKMPTESAQMLAHWAHAIYNTKIHKSDGTPYAIKPSILSHPCTKWLYVNTDHVFWLLVHARILCYEYKGRYKKIHGALNAIEDVYNLYCSEGHSIHVSLKDIKFELAMPDVYKDPSDPIQSYRNYLMGEKGYAVWNHSCPPAWWDHEVHAPVRQKYLIDRELKKIRRRQATLT